MRIQSEWKGNVDSENGIAMFFTEPNSECKSIELTDFGTFQYITQLLDSEYKRGRDNGIAELHAVMRNYK